MEKLPPPLKRYLLGARPSHAPLSKLSENFEGLTQDLLVSLLSAGGYLTEQGKASSLAAEEGLVDSCERKLLWRVERVQEVLESQGMKLTRQAVNQEVALPESGEPQFANLGTLATYFSVTARQVGKWLDELGWREEDGAPTKAALDAGLATLVEMHVVGKKTRSVTHWEVNLTRQKLVEAGHELNFDYEEAHRGRGRNSDVEVGAVDQRAKEFAREFARLYKDASTRKKTPYLVQSTPRAIVQRAEELLRKPGFITSGKYRENL